IFLRTGNCDHSPNSSGSNEGYLRNRVPRRYRGERAILLAPYRLSRVWSFCWVGNDLLAQFVEIAFKISDSVDLLELATLQRCEPNPRRLTQCLQLRGIFGLSLLDQTQTFA